jgi:creatinine amidohydrolase
MRSVTGSAAYLGNVSGPACRAASERDPVYLQPIGAVEHHGPHLPLATDTLIADAMARAVVTEHPELNVIVLPTLSYGLSSEHLWAPGTISLGAATLLAVLDDVGASTVRAGASRFCLLNAHGGNTHLLRVAARELRARHGLTTFLAHCDLPPDNGGPPGDPREEGLGIHGGISETSVALHLFPELVDMSLAERAVPSWINEYRALGFERGAEFGWLSNDLSASGVAGDPTLASAEHGRESFAAAVEGLAASLAEMADFTYGQGPRRP